MTWEDILKSDRCIKPAMAYFNKQALPLYRKYTAFKGELEVFQYYENNKEGFIDFMKKMQSELNKKNPEPGANNYRQIYLESLMKIVNETMLVYENCADMSDLR